MSEAKTITPLITAIADFVACAEGVAVTPEQVESIKRKDERGIGLAQAETVLGAVCAAVAGGHLSCHEVERHTAALIDAARAVNAALRDQR